MVVLTGLHHTGLFVRSLEASLKFYTEVLGMEAFRIVPPQAFLRFGRGDELALFEQHENAPTDGPEKLENPHGKAHVAFQLSGESYAAAKVEFRERKIAFTTMKWGDHECLYFLDPDGNLLELGGPKTPAGGPATTTIRSDG